MKWLRQRYEEQLGRTPNQRVPMTPVGIRREIEDHLEKGCCEREKQATVEEFI